MSAVKFRLADKRRNITRESLSFSFFYGKTYALALPIGKFSSQVVESR